MSFVRTKLACVSGLALAAALVPGAAVAQSTTTGSTTGAVTDCRPGQPPAECPPEEDRNQRSTNADGSTSTSGADEILVTGTRIRSRNEQSFEPSLTVDRTYFEDRNLTNVADALNELPNIRGSVTPAGAQGSFGQGVNFVNNFGLGSNRTLTLVNGRRVVTSNPTTLFNQGSAGTQVDLNTIQSILVDRIDNIDVGGAPVYGSDAISGVVNIVLRDRFKGLEATALSGVTEQGDGFRYSFSALAGHDYFDGRANITLAYTHDEQKGVLYNDRSFYRDNLGGATNPTSAQALALGRTAASGITALNDGRVNTGFGYNNSATDGFPGTIQIRNETIYQLTPGGLITAAVGNTAAGNFRYQFDASGKLVPFSTGVIFPSIYASGGDGFKFSDYSQITSEVKRDTLNAFAHFDVSDALKFFFEGEYFHSRTDELVQQPTFNSTLFSGSSGPLVFSSTSPFLTAQARTQLAALGITRFQVSRASGDLADVTGYATTNLGRAVIGARGDFNVGSRKFYYEATANYGRNVIRDTSQDLDRQKFINAVNVTTNAAGQIVCTATPAVQAAPGGTPIADPNCVPLNVLGFGVSSPAARAYVISENDTFSVLQQKVFTASVGGSPFSIFGNDQSFSIGYEHREEEASFTPSRFQQLGLGRSTAVGALSGKYNVDEVFGEIQATIVSPVNDLAFLNRLEVFGRARHVDNTVNGGFLSWSAGGAIAPVKDITFRGNYTKSFRAPAITELFLPISPAFSTVPDLCSAANINAGAAPAIRNRNCTAFLAQYPTATPLLAAAATVPSLSGGNPTLQNEVARSFSYGVIVQPRWIPGLTVSADYIDINISNPISNLSVATIASACFDNADFNTADPANGNAFCSQIRRTATGQVVNDPANPGVVSGFVNGRNIFFSGIQGTVNYATGLSGLNLPGRIGIGNTIFFVRRRLSDITGVAPVRTDGTFGDPKFTSQSNVRYENDLWGVSTSVNFVGQQIAARTGLSLDLREFNKIDPYATVNASVFLKVNKQFRLTLTATNVGNRIGQEYFGYYPTTLISDALGRRFAVSANAKF